MQEMQVLWRWIEGKRVDRDAVLSEAEFDIAPAQQRCQLPVAVPDIEVVMVSGLRRRAPRDLVAVALARLTRLMPVSESSLLPDCICVEFRRRC
jgi:hypothetical protein